MSNREDLYIYNKDMKKILKSLPIDYSIDIFDLVRYDMSWEKYHHNETWATFGFINEQNELECLYPQLKVKLDCFLKGIQSERSNIDYELYVTFKRKYFHIQYRRKEK